MLEVPGAVIFNIAFLELILESNFDYLYYGNTTLPNKDEALGSLTGYELPSSLEIRGETAWFIFTSDLNGNYKGFYLTWQTTGKF